MKNKIRFVTGLIMLVFGAVCWAEPQLMVQTPIGTVENLKYSLDGNYLLANCGYEIIVYEVASCKEVKRFVTNVKDKNRVDISPDMKYYAVYDDNDEICLINIKNGEKRILGNSGSKVTHFCIAFSCDGKKIAVPGEEHTTYIYDVDTGNLQDTIFLGSDFSCANRHCDCFVWSAKGTYLGIIAEETNKSYKNSNHIGIIYHTGKKKNNKNRKNMVLKCLAISSDEKLFAWHRGSDILLTTLHGMRKTITFNKMVERIEDGILFNTSQMAFSIDSQNLFFCIGDDHSLKYGLPDIHLYVLNCKTQAIKELNIYTSTGSCNIAIHPGNWNYAVSIEKIHAETIFDSNTVNEPLLLVYNGMNEKWIKINNSHSKQINLDLVSDKILVKNSKGQTNYFFDSQLNCHVLNQDSDVDFYSRPIRPRGEGSMKYKDFEGGCYYYQNHKIFRYTDANNESQQVLYLQDWSYGDILAVSSDGLHIVVGYNEIILMCSYKNGCLTIDYKDVLSKNIWNGYHHCRLSSNGRFLYIGGNDSLGYIYNADKKSSFLLNHRGPGYFSSDDFFLLVDDLNYTCVYNAQTGELVKSFHKRDVVFGDFSRVKNNILFLFDNNGDYYSSKSFVMYELNVHNMKEFKFVQRFILKDNFNHSDLVDISKDGKNVIVISLSHLLSLQNGDNVLEAYAMNEAGKIESRHAVANIHWQGYTDKPNLFVLAVGVNKYRDRSL